jgi:hypothetical protein
MPRCGQIREKKNKSTPSSLSPTSASDRRECWDHSDGGAYQAGKTGPGMQGGARAKRRCSGLQFVGRSASGRGRRFRSSASERRIGCPGNQGQEVIGRARAAARPLNASRIPSFEGGRLWLLLDGMETGVQDGLAGKHTAVSGRARAKVLPRRRRPAAQLFGLSCCRRSCLIPQRDAPMGFIFSSGLDCPFLFISLAQGAGATRELLL